MKDSGTELDLLKIVNYSEYSRGLHAAEDIKYDEIALYIPFTQLITFDMI